MKINIYKERLRGYIDAHNEHGIPIDESLIMENDMQLEGGRISTTELLRRKVDFDCIFSASDYSAMGAMQVLKENNLKIPQDVALAGFANEPFTSFTDPTLSTVDQLSLMMGQAIGNMFFNKLNDQQTYVEKMVLKPKLIIRESSMKSRVVQQRTAS